MASRPGAYTSEEVRNISFRRCNGLTFMPLEDRKKDGERERVWERKGEVLSLGQMHVEVGYSVRPPLAGNCHVMKLLMFGGIYRPDIHWLPSPTFSRTGFSFVGLHKRNTGNMWRVINFPFPSCCSFCLGFPLFFTVSFTNSSVGAMVLLLTLLD